MLCVTTPPPPACLPVTNVCRNFVVTASMRANPHADKFQNDIRRRRRLLLLWRRWWWCWRSWIFLAWYSARCMNMRVWKHRCIYTKQCRSYLWYRDQCFLMLSLWSPSTNINFRREKNWIEIIVKVSLDMVLQFFIFYYFLRLFAKNSQALPTYLCLILQRLALSWVRHRPTNKK